MAAIDVRGVTKRYPGDVVAVRDLDLTVREGEVFGFLGPNGAGKSTTINMLLDFVRPSAGSVRVLGRDVTADGVAVRQRTGVLPEAFDVYDRLTGRQHLEFAIESKEAADDPDAVLDRVGLAGAGDRRAGGYSSGMRQRLVLGMALVGDPELLILDEPSTGLDPNGAMEMRAIVREEVDRGATVFFSSHLLGQVEAVCDRVGILRQGRLVALDSIEGLREAIGGRDTLRITVEAIEEDTLEAVRSVAGVADVERLDGRAAEKTEVKSDAAGTAAGDQRVTLAVSCDDDAKSSVLRVLEEAGVTVRDFETVDASLEELFRAYTTEAGPGSAEADDGVTAADEGGRP